MNHLLRFCLGCLATSAFILGLMTTEAGTHAIGGVLYSQELPTPPMPPSGNPGHEEPAPGAACHHPVDQVSDPSHDCHCERKCEMDDEGRTTTVEDPKCRAFCYRSHCHCGDMCA